MIGAEKKENSSMNKDSWRSKGRGQVCVCVFRLPSFTWWQFLVKYFALHGSLRSSSLFYSPSLPYTHTHTYHTHTQTHTHTHTHTRTEAERERQRENSYPSHSIFISQMVFVFPLFLFRIAPISLLYTKLQIIRCLSWAKWDMTAFQTFLLNSHQNFQALCPSYRWRNWSS